MQQNVGLSRPLDNLIRQAIERNGGWLPFDRFMAMALYAPGLGYYARERPIFGVRPESGSDYITAPELSPLFGQTLARQVTQALQASDCTDVWEFGAGTGALAAQLLDALGEQIRTYNIIEISSALRVRQIERLAPYAPKVQWLHSLPPQMQGVILGNEVLDAMPVQLLHFDGERWFERGVVALADRWGWSDRPTDLRPSAADECAPGTVTEIHPQAEAFIITLAERLKRGAAFFIDYGFPEKQYYHPDRIGGSLRCHRAHHLDMDPLTHVGDKDITAHVNFSSLALTAQQAGMQVVGYTSQAHFLMNCGILDFLPEGAPFQAIAGVQTLLSEHEMGESFKVIAFAKDCSAVLTDTPLGFMRGDRTHTL